jgi:hypothetical protein
MEDDCGGGQGLSWAVELGAGRMLRLRMFGAPSPLPQYIFMAWCLVKHRDFTFTFTFTFFTLDFIY